MRSQDIRADIEPYISALIELDNETNPSRGRLTEPDKLKKARQAIEMWWRLYDVLMLWAQSHIVGYCHARDDSALREVLPTLGLPAAVRGMTWMDDIIPQKSARRTSSRKS